MKIIKKIIPFLLILSLLAAWMYNYPPVPFLKNLGGQGWPRVWQNPAIPPEIQETMASTTSWSTATAGTNWAVPAGVYSIKVKTWGAGGGGAGGGYNSTAAVGGGGGFAQDTVSVTPGEILTIVVGGGGGKGLNLTCNSGGTDDGGGGGGGGYSAVKNSGGTYLVLAGGGGGGGSSSAATESGGAGGGGGGQSGKAGTNGGDTAAGYGNGGAGGTPSAGGARGDNSSCGSCGLGANGSAYNGGAGGAGGSSACGGAGGTAEASKTGGAGGNAGTVDAQTAGAGGGGAGYYGGGGGEAGIAEGAGGGGGGSAYCGDGSCSVYATSTSQTVASSTDVDYITYCGGVGDGGSAGAKDADGSNGENGCIAIILNTAPSFTGNGPADSSDPVLAGEVVTFSGTASDPESDAWYLAVCKTSWAATTTPPACASITNTYCTSTSAVASGASNSCTWTSTGSGAQTWYAFACDSGNSLGIRCSSASTSDITVNAVAYAISRSAGDGTIAYGNVGLSGTTSTDPAGSNNDPQTFQNDSNVPAQFNIMTGDAVGGAGWEAVSGTPGSNQFRHSFATTSPVTYWKVMGLDPSYAMASSSVAVGGQVTFYLQIEMPNASDYIEKDIQVTVQVAPP